MRTTAISSPQNPLLKKVRALSSRQERESLGLFLVEGYKLVIEACRNNLIIESTIASESFMDKEAPLPAQIDELIVVPDKEFAKLVSTDSSCHILAVCQIPEVHPDLFSSGQTLLIADRLQDPGNLGTLIRAALAFSAGGVILTNGSVDPYNPKVVRSAMGSLFAIPVIKDLSFSQAVKDCKSHGYKIIACDAKADKPFWQAIKEGKCAFVFGNEGQGLSREELAQCDQVVSIPQNPQCESLNVAVSAAIVLFGAYNKELFSK